MRRWVATLVALLGLTGCASAAGPPGGRTPSVAVPRPGGAQDRALLASAGPAADCDARASFRPTGTLPPPGQLPPASSMARIVQKGRLVVGVSQDAYLFGYRDSGTGQLVGFDIDIAYEMAKALFGDPSKIQFKAISSADRIPAIQRGDVDLVVRQTTMTCARWNDVYFSSEYYSAAQRVLVPSNSTVTSLDGLAGKRVCAAAQTTSIANIVAKLPQAQPVSTVDASDCLVMLQQGQVDAISTDDAILAGFAAEDPNTRLLDTPPLSAEPYGIMIAQSGKDLVQFVNGVLARLRDDGTWAAIYRRWLTRLGPPPAPPVARYRD